MPAYITREGLLLRKMQLQEQRIAIEAREAETDYWLATLDAIEATNQETIQEEETDGNGDSADNGSPAATRGDEDGNGSNARSRGAGRSRATSAGTRRRR